MLGAGEQGQQHCEFQCCDNCQENGDAEYICCDPGEYVCQLVGNEGEYHCCRQGAPRPLNRVRCSPWTCLSVACHREQQWTTGFRIMRRHLRHDSHPAALFVCCTATVLHPTALPWPFPAAATGHAYYNCYYDSSEEVGKSLCCAPDTKACFASYSNIAEFGTCCSPGTTCSITEEEVTCGACRALHDSVCAPSNDICAMAAARLARIRSPCEQDWANTAHTDRCCAG